MIRATSFQGKTVAVFGLGSSGIAAAHALLAGGASVAAWDDSTAGRTAAGGAGVPVVNLTEADWAGFAALYQEHQHRLRWQRRRRLELETAR